MREHVVIFFQLPYLSPLRWPFLVCRVTASVATDGGSVCAIGSPLSFFGLKNTIRIANLMTLVAFSDLYVVFAKLFVRETVCQMQECAGALTVLEASVRQYFNFFEIESVYVISALVSSVCSFLQPSQIVGTPKVFFQRTTAVAYLYLCFVYCSLHKTVIGT